MPCYRHRCQLLFCLCGINKPGQDKTGKFCIYELIGGHSQPGAISMMILTMSNKLPLANINLKCYSQRNHMPIINHYVTASYYKSQLQ